MNTAVSMIGDKHKGRTCADVQKAKAQLKSTVRRGQHSMLTFKAAAA